MGLLTTSRLKAARACQRYHHLRYELGYRAVQEEDVLRFGTLVHKGLEAWWLGKMNGSADPLADALAAVQGEADPFDRVRAEVVLTGYHHRWNEEPYRVVGVEVEFETQLVNPATGRASQTWTLGGKIDAVVEDLRDGQVRIVEHKTSSEDITTGSAYWKRLRMDGQVSVYFAGARKALGLDVAGCLYDVLYKPGLHPAKATPVENRQYTQEKSKACPECKKKSAPPAPHTVDGLTCENGRIVTDPGGRLYANMRAEDETPEEFRARLIEAIANEPDRYYARGEVVRLDQEMADALFDIWQLGQQIRESELAQRAPRNPDACIRYGKPCEFFEVCSGAASLEDPALFTRSANVHPELEQSKEAAC